MIVGMGEVTSVASIKLYDTEADYTYPLWEMVVQHSIRQELQDSKGFLLPYNQVLEIMKELADDGMTMVVVTHEMGFAREVATRVLFMDGGNIVEQNEPKEFFANPQHPRLKDFLSKVL